MDLRKINFNSLLFYSLIPLMLGFIVAMIIPDYRDFYSSLNKPFNLPAIVFPIVWSILYVVMGIAAYFVDEEGDDKAIRLYYIQLFVNLLWTPVFFGLKSLLWGMIVALFLAILVILTAIKFYQSRKLSGYLMIPYVIWSLFALYLTISIYALN